jgi:hypothetical protein
VGHSGYRCATEARDGTPPQGNEASKMELVMGMAFVVIDNMPNNGASVGMCAYVKGWEQSGGAANGGRNRERR